MWKSKSSCHHTTLHGQPINTCFFVLWALIKCRGRSSSGGIKVNRNIYYGKLELWWMPQLPEGTQNVVFQHDEVPTYIHNEVTFLNKQLTSQGESSTWPPHSTGLTPPWLLPVRLSERWGLHPMNAFNTELEGSNTNGNCKKWTASIARCLVWRGEYILNPRTVRKRTSSVAP